MSQPKRTRVYQNHHLDSTRWDVIEPEDGDIVVTTAYKSGTTWTRHIVHQLVVDDVEPVPESVMIWPEARFMGMDLDALAGLAASASRPRLLSTHLPLDGLPYWPEARYLLVGRDPRDVFMSFHNHYWNYTDLAFSMLNSPDRIGPELPPCPEDPRVLWQDWMTRGWFEWESEGYPFWANLRHTQTYWDHRDLPNLLFLHYNDMLADLAGSVRRIADFLGIEATDDRVTRTVEATQFSSMKQKAVEQSRDADPRTAFWRGGPATFINKGTNGRWRDVLTTADLALYDDAKARVLDPDCAAWLEQGGEVARG